MPTGWTRKRTGGQLALAVLATGVTLAASAWASTETLLASYEPDEADLYV